MKLTHADMCTHTLCAGKTHTHFNTDTLASDREDDYDVTDEYLSGFWVKRSFSLYVVLYGVRKCSKSLCIFFWDICFIMQIYCLNFAKRVWSIIGCLWQVPSVTTCPGVETRVKQESSCVHQFILCKQIWNMMHLQ